MDKLNGGPRTFEPTKPSRVPGSAADGGPPPRGAAQGEGRGPAAFVSASATGDARGAQPAALGDRTALEMHSAFFDRNHDGIITLRETYEGLRAIGIGRVLSAWFALVINGALGLPTSRSFVPTLSITLENIHRAKHASDTGVYDKDGRFDPQKFDELFARWDKDRDGALNARELVARTLGDRDLLDVFGFLASAGEWGVLYALAGKGGKLTREQLRRMYDGTLFYELEREKQAARTSASAPA
ncbi:caleosin family protein [Sorangium sp. So ce394]|uniref:caleosin family protein n=1 Tax=Sorangium sp. So ce394 TaxID=3133310 RepID=UPI003F5B9445